MMRKKKMKSIRIVIMMMMIMLSCTEGNDIMPEKSCSAKCAPGCIFANLAYPICYAICIDKCRHPYPPSVSPDCITSCTTTITKSTSNNIGIPFLTILISFALFTIQLCFYIFLIINYLFLSEDRAAMKDALKSCLRKCHFKL